MQFAYGLMFKFVDGWAGVRGQVDCVNGNGSGVAVTREQT